MSSDRETEALGRRAVAPREAHEPGAGDQVGPWRLEAEIASGGCGAVFRASHRILARRAAVKLLRADLARSPSMVARFVQEARAVNLIGHPHIVDIFDFGELPGCRPYFAMELLAEENLEDRVHGAGRLTIAEAGAIATPIAAALTAAHVHGFIHRDVKPRNVGFARTPAGELVKLLDFGIAKLIEPAADGTASSTVRVGSPHSMAPEQIRAEPVGAWTDVYGLAVTVYFMLAGRYPFEAEDADELERMHLEDLPAPLTEHADVPPPLDAAVAAGLAKRPADRPTLRGLLEPFG